MNRRQFFGLLAAAPVAIAAGPPAIAMSRKAFAMCAPPLKNDLGAASIKAMQDFGTSGLISPEEFQERYIKPYCEAMERSWRDAERNGTAWWLPLDMQRGVNRPYYQGNSL